MALTPPYALVHPLTRDEWRAWLALHHASQPGAWLVTYKQGTGRPRLPYEDAVEELLCFGWIDSRPSKVDDERSALLCTPRKKTSAWSAPNKARAERMIARGRMTPAGAALIDHARATGLWTKLDGVEALTVPPDLAAALAAAGDAAAHFAAFPRSAVRGMLEWIEQAKTAETRNKRIALTAAAAARNERALQWKPKGRPCA